MQTQTTSKAFKESRARLVTQVKNLEKQVVQTEKEKSSLAQRFDAQPQVDGETWQFQGDSGEWISFTDPLKMFGMFVFPPRCGKQET